MKNYAAAEGNSQNIGTRYKMIIDVLLSILSGENPEVLLEYYKTKLYTVDLLEEMATADDAVLRTVIRNIDNQTLVTALSGTSGTVCIRFLRNLSDRLLYFIHEDIQAVQTDHKAVLDAQRKMLELVKTSN